jgi:hypothetical protein
MLQFTDLHYYGISDDHSLTKIKGSDNLFYSQHSKFKNCLTKVIEVKLKVYDPLRLR